MLEARWQAGRARGGSSGRLEVCAHGCREFFLQLKKTLARNGSLVNPYAENTLYLGLRDLGRQCRHPAFLDLNGTIEQLIGAQSLEIAASRAFSESYRNGGCGNDTQGQENEGATSDGVQNPL